MKLQKHTTLYECTTINTIAYFSLCATAAAALYRAFFSSNVLSPLRLFSSTLFVHFSNLRAFFSAFALLPFIVLLSLAIIMIIKWRYKTEVTFNFSQSVVGDTHARTNSKKKETKIRKKEGKIRGRRGELLKYELKTRAFCGQNKFFFSLFRFCFNFLFYFSSVRKRFFSIFFFL